MLLSLTYFSSATEVFEVDDLVALLEDARRRNTAAGVTGVLVHHDHSFAQALEGPEDAVRETFARIGDDPRHRGLFVGIEERVTRRAFPDWAMSFRDLTGAGADELEGYSTFLRDVREGRPALGDAPAHHLLRAFVRPRPRLS